MRTMKKLLPAAALLLFGLLSLAACTGAASSGLSGSSAPTPGSPVSSTSLLTPPEMAKNEARQSGPPPAVSGESVPPPPTAASFSSPAAPFTLNWETLGKAWQQEMEKDVRVKSAEWITQGPMIRLTLRVNDDFEPKQLEALKEDALTALNALALGQDAGILPAKEGYYGGLYDAYAVEIGIGASAQAKDEWLLYELVAKGSHSGTE